jgi:hypothetical protein
LVLLLAGWDANVRALQLADPNHSSAGAIVLVALSVLWTILRGAGVMLIRNRLMR